MGSRYSVHNRRYIRVSDDTVVPVSIYLQEKNASWFDDGKLQQILACLQPVLVEKLNAFDPKKDGKNVVADVFRTQNVQFAYYVRSTDTRHAVMLRNRNFVPANRRRTRRRSTSSSASRDVNFVTEDDEEEAKPVLETTLQGYYVSKKTLVVVPEPYDPANPRAAPPEFMHLNHKKTIDIAQLFLTTSSTTTLK